MIKKLCTIVLFSFGAFQACSPPPVEHGDLIDAYRLQVGAEEITFEQQMLYLVAALEIYRLHVGAYPSVDNNLEALIAKPEVLEATGTWFGPYAESDAFFTDPWGKKLYYKVDSKEVFDLRSLGPDGVESDDDYSVQEMFPDWFREVKKLSELGPIPINKTDLPSP